MPRYEVTLTEELWHTIILDAKNKTEAGEKAWKTLQEKGTDAFKQDDSEWNSFAHVEQLEEDEDYEG
jgi:hypothetical protein